KNQNEKNSISMLFADRRQYTPGSISFPAPGEYTDSKLSVISFNSKITDNIYFKAGNTKNNTDNFNLAANKTNPVDNENSIYEISYRNENLAFGISKESQKAYIESPWGGKYDEKRDIDSIFLEYIIGKSVYFNLRQDKYNDFKDEDSFNITYKLSDNLKAGYGEGYSLPTFNQLYWPGFSNPALKAEYSEVYSLNYENKDLSFFVFNNKYNDLMQYDPLLFKTLNIAKAEIKGFETKYKINDEIELFYKHQNPQNKTNKSKLNYRQLNKAGISYKKDNCNLYVNHIGKRYNNGKEFPQTTVINLKLNFDKSFISIVNLFDKEYTIQDDYEKACREFSFGFEISI
ncbi:MAG: hypothetical protein M0Q02_12325, partial [Candidatus Muirbacterium halophilum]|nr:hypothetical protein [Candidatus Muirbacterium halophilum]